MKYSSYFTKNAQKFIKKCLEHKNRHNVVKIQERTYKKIFEDISKILFKDCIKNTVRRILILTLFVGLYH